MDNTNLDGEEWRPVVGKEGIYEISNIGRTRSLDRAFVKADGKRWKYKGKILTPQMDKRGYLRVGLCNTKKYVHTLVAQSFIPNNDPKRLIQVNHKNEDKSDNRVENLEWCDNIYNSRYGSRGKRIGEKASIAVIQIKPDGSISRFNSLTEAAKSVGASTTEISFACKGKKNTCRGSIWRYADNDNSEQVAFNQEISRKRVAEGHRKTALKVSVAVIQLSTCGSFISEYPSISAAERITGVGNTSICKVCRGVTKTAGGYKWKYKPVHGDTRPQVNRQDRPAY